ncbi:Tissue factor [Collichthys lucidus]|uniref:Tissue factor n=1 Tax=Collichthys lucidus TaxID=240159 RepID=A0A4U5V042_COLLU|nr:Tissue factor [Collichthys lucidus]
MGIGINMRDQAFWYFQHCYEGAAPKAENVRWVSLDFKTVLTWTVKPSVYTYSVRFSEGDSDWRETLDCTKVTDSECDLTNNLNPLDRDYTADIITEPLDAVDDYILEEFPHTETERPFNPYKESNISAVEFTLEPLNESTMIVNITDPLSSIHVGQKQLTIRDVLKKDLKYKISYHKSGSTGKRDYISNTSVAEVSKLDAGENYCFMVAAYIPSRPKATQLGAWSVQQCHSTPGHKDILPDHKVRQLERNSLNL